MVTAVHGLTFEIDTTPEATETYAEIKDIEEVEISIEGNVETWTPTDTDGFQRALRTGLSMELSFSGKRNFGDAGNDFVAGLALAVGESANTTIKITTNETTPTTYTIPCVIDVDSILGGASTDVASLSFTAMSDGAVTIA